MAMMDSLISDLSKNVDNSLRVIIIKADGPVFSAGHDLRELVSYLFFLLLELT